MKRYMMLVMLMVVVLASCAPAPTKSDAMMDKSTPTAETMMEKATPTTDAMMKKDMPTPDAMMAKATPTADTMMSKVTPTAVAMADKAMTGAAWFNAQLTDVNTGKTFKVSDLKGKVVLVETMAVWCSTCLKQQGEVKKLHDLLGKRDDLVSLALDIDPNETDRILKTHATSRGFDWLYAVAPAEAAREIGQIYGNQFLNPPSAPMLIVDRQGQVHPLPFGIKSAQDLKASIELYLKQG